MRQSEHKAEAERLAKAVESQLDLIVRNLNTGSVANPDSFNMQMRVADLTCAKAHVHATLAAIPDPIDHRGLGV